ncbi:MAG: hypothetical protein GC136_10350 [Alphaproteobacteria bacterium]|nr:hypothetical protein [Alphaproteobacteria bacterium]
MKIGKSALYALCLLVLSAGVVVGNSNKAYANGGGEGAEVGPEFVQLSPLILPVVDKNGISQTVSLVISLEVGDKLAADKVTRYSPKLKDAYLQDLYGVLYRKTLMENGVIQIGALKQRLNSLSQKVMGDGVVSDVLLQVVQQRPI